MQTVLAGDCKVADDSPVVPDGQSGDSAGSTIDARGAMGTQIGPGGTQINIFPGLAGPPPDELPQIPGAVPVGDTDLRRLGVHPAITIAGTPVGAQPAYVLRDTDTAEFGLRARIRAAAVRSGFVLLTGGSSVGKTRSAAEAVKEVLPQWQLIHPAGPEEVTALTRQPPARAVIWLDELQNYLDGPDRLAGAVRALLNAPGPLVIVGTLRPDQPGAYTPAISQGDPRAREREVLDLADVVWVAEEFSAAERARANTAGKNDRQIAAVLVDDVCRLPEALAAAPELVAFWDRARVVAPYAWAVLTAALDTARLGVRAPLPGELLGAAAPGYCTSRQLARGAADWLDGALEYASQALRGAAAALDPIPAGMGQLAGYMPADYLVQHAARERSGASIPASLWGALAAAPLSLADTWRLAQSAERLQLLRYAVVLYRRLYDAGEPAADELFRAAADRGDVDSLRSLAEASNEQAELWLTTMVADQDPLGTVTRLVDAGDVGVLRKLAHSNSYAAERLAFLLAERGEIADVARILEGRADSGDRDAAGLLVSLLVEYRELDRLRTLAADGFGHGRAAIGLVNKLIELGDIDRLREVPVTVPGTPPSSWPTCCTLAATAAACGS